MRALLESAACPWAAPIHLAARLDASVETVEAACRSLVARGLMQRATQRLSHLPPDIFAPTGAGLDRLSRAIETSPDTIAAWARLSPERFWLLRAGLDLTQQSYAVCAAIAAAHETGAVRFDVMLIRQFRKRLLPLHARIAVRDRDSPDAWRAFHLLIDDGHRSPTAWARTMRYEALTARRNKGDAPGLLIVTTTAFRAAALLRLARDLGTRMAAFATWDRSRLFREGRARWVALVPGDRDAGELIDADPFAHGALVSACSKHLPSTAASLRRTRARDPHPYAWEGRPAWAEGLERIESLDDEAMRALAFVCAHPACPATTVAAFTETDATVLARLCESGLIERGDSLVATAQAVGLCALRQGREPAAAVRAYAAFARERTRRPDHARAVFAFFELLKRDCALRSRIARPSDAPGPPHYELATFDDELTARVSFKWRGERRFWWPDAYGLLRVGTAWTSFWLEIDGTDNTPARTQLSKWQAKLDALCAYRASGQWAYRFSAFPMWWVVTTDLSNSRVIRDLAETSARAYGVGVPEVVVVGAEEPTLRSLDRLGNLAK